MTSYEYNVVMGFFHRLARKFKRDEKFINMIGRTFWPCLILSIGWWMLWVADTSYSGFRKQPVQVHDINNNNTDPIETFDIDNSVTINEDTSRIDTVKY